MLMLYWVVGLNDCEDILPPFLLAEDDETTKVGLELVSIGILRLNLLELFWLKRSARLVDLVVVGRVIKPVLLPKLL